MQRRFEERDAEILRAVRMGPQTVAEIGCRIRWDRQRSPASKAAEVGASLRRLCAAGLVFRQDARQCGAVWEAKRND